MEHRNNVAQCLCGNSTPRPKPCSYRQSTAVELPINFSNRGDHNFKNTMISTLKLSRRSWSISSTLASKALSTPAAAAAATGSAADPALIKVCIASLFLPVLMQYHICNYFIKKSCIANHKMLKNILCMCFCNAAAVVHVHSF